MINNVDAIIEVYNILKEYVPSKERQAAADHVMSAMVDVLDDKEIKELASTDRYLRNSLQEYSVDDDEDEDNEEIDDYDE